MKKEGLLEISVNCAKVKKWENQKVWVANRKQATEGGTWAICWGAGTTIALWDVYHYFPYPMGGGVTQANYTCSKWWSQDLNSTTWAPCPKLLAFMVLSW